MKKKNVAIFVGFIVVAIFIFVFLWFNKSISDDELRKEYLLVISINNNHDSNIKKWKFYRGISDKRMRIFMLNELHRFIDSDFCVNEDKEIYYKKSLVFDFREYMKKEDKNLLIELSKINEDEIAFEAVSTYIDFVKYDMSDLFVDKLLNSSKYDDVMTVVNVVCNYFPGKDSFFVRKEKIRNIRRMFCSMDRYSNHFVGCINPYVFDKILSEYDNGYLGSSLRRELIREFREDRSCMFDIYKDVGLSYEWVNYLRNGWEDSCYTKNKISGVKMEIPSYFFDDINNILLFDQDGSTLNVVTRCDKLRLFQKKNGISDMQVCFFLESIINDGINDINITDKNVKIITRAFKLLPVYADVNTLKYLEGLICNNSFCYKMSEPFILDNNSIEPRYYIRQSLIQSYLKLSDYNITPSIQALLNDTSDNTYVDRIFVCHEFMLAWYDVNFKISKYPSVDIFKNRKNKIQNLLFSEVVKTPSCELHYFLDKFLVENIDGYIGSESRKNDFLRRYKKIKSGSNQQFEEAKVSIAKGWYVIDVVERGYSGQ